MAPILTSLQSGWLIALLVIWAALLFGGYLVGRPPHRSDRRMPTWTRMSSSLVLVVAAWSWAVIVRNTPVATSGLLIGIGMALGFLGDLCMAGLIRTANRVLGGMSGFGLGHVAYIAAGACLASQLGLDALAPLLLGWLIWLLIGLVGWYVVVFRGRPPTALHWAALPYSMLLATTAGVATGLTVQSPRFALFALGAGLFLLSDLMIAAKMFAKKSFRAIAIDDLIWLSYGPGQMLIVYSVYAAIA